MKKAHTNIILICIDTLRADHLSCYGYPRKTSPNIDALAEKGILFENHIAPATHTTPVFTSMFTGQNPFHHGVIATLHAVVNHKDMILDDLTPTLPDVLWRNGYETVAFDNLFSFRAIPKWHARGFKYYINLTNDSTTSDFPNALTADNINQELLPWVEKVIDEEKKYFFFVHYWDPHEPYNQPDDFKRIFSRNLEDLERTSTPAGGEYILGVGPEKILNHDLRERVCLYDEEIRYVDAKIGELLEKIKKVGLYNDSLIIITADHGEGLGEHGCYDHRFPYEGTIRTPLIIKPPGNFPNKRIRIKSLTSHTDFVPTILDWANIDWSLGLPPLTSKKELYTRYPYLDLDGYSILPLINGEKQQIRSSVISTGCYFLYKGGFKSIEVGLRTTKYKLIVRRKVPPRTYNVEEIAGLPQAGFAASTRSYHAFNQLPKIELLDFNNDPLELANLADEKREIVARVMEKLEPVLNSPLFLHGRP